MRNDSRKLRSFRPVNAILEGRNPVSSLIPGISAPPQQSIAPSATASRISPPPLQKSAAVQLLSNSTSIKATPQVFYARATDNIRLVTTTRTSSANSLSGKTLAGSLLTTSIPSVPSAASVPLPTPKGGAGSAPAKLFGGAAMVPASAPTQTAPAQVTAASNANVLLAASSAATSGDGDGQIRPMTIRHSVITKGKQSGLDSPDSGSGSGSSGSSNGSTTTNHDISVPDPTYAIIGAPFSGNVVSINNSPQFKQVVWQATGVVQSETYVNSMGSFTPQSTVTHKFGGQNQPPVTSTDVFGFYWGNTPGTYSITATATFTDGVTVSDSQSVTVIAPSVNSFTVTSTPWAWQPDQINQTGFTVQNPITMTASVYIPDSIDGANFAGTISLIQKVDMTETVTNFISGVHVIDTHGLVLDTPTAATDPAGHNFLYQYQPPLTYISAGSSGSWSTSDIPKSLWNTGVDKASGKNDTAMDVKTSVTLEDHLVFQPSSGIWVNLATSTPIVMTGEEAFKQNPDGTWSWSDVVASTPSNTTVMATHQDYNIVTWTNWYGNPAITWNPPYNY
jgi:hypothetical protein